MAATRNFDVLLSGSALEHPAPSSRARAPDGYVQLAL